MSEQITITLAVPQLTIDPGAIPSVTDAPELGAQLALIANSVEGEAGYDPSGILVAAEDTADGVQISISGAEADGPEHGVSWSVPAEGVLGTLLGAVGSASGRSPLLALAAAVERVAWSKIATPNNRMYWVGLADGPIETCSNGVFYCVENVAAGEQQISVYRKNGGSWTLPQAASSGAAAIRGVAGSPSGVPIGIDNNGYAIGAAYPLEGGTSSLHRVLVLTTLSIAAGRTPHLIFGAGGPLAGEADTVTIAGLLAALRVENMEALVA